jgi:sugar phosphate isomerase/epimerase|tara:strand:+ start:562 stop:1407 length:846 start_codon:yes stop_codon:yes gene_type:complete
MIYVSSSCVKNEFIWQSVETLAKNGFKNIELSGGTERDSRYTKHLHDLKEKFNLNYRCHNYFPPPEEHFVMNLASDSDEISSKTINIINESVKLSKIYGATEYGFHAGFLTDISTSEIGKSVQGRDLFDRKEANNRFIERLKNIDGLQDIKLYVENNVVSRNNYANFGNQNCFLLTSYEDVEAMKSKLDFNLLLDIGHLYVSCNTLGKNFDQEFNLLSELTDYIHVSDNNGISDENKRLKKGSKIHHALLASNLKDKTFTLEINNDIKGLTDSYDILMELI